MEKRHAKNYFLQKLGYEFLFLTYMTVYEKGEKAKRLKIEVEQDHLWQNFIGDTILYIRWWAAVPKSLVHGRGYKA